MNLPGQGFTQLHDRAFAFDLPAMTAAVDVFLDAVVLRRTALAGNSWSGGRAVAFAQRWTGCNSSPERSGTGANATVALSRGRAGPPAGQSAGRRDRVRASWSKQ